MAPVAIQTIIHTIDDLLRHGISRDNLITFRDVALSDAQVVLRHCDEDGEVERRRLRVEYNACTRDMDIFFMPSDAHQAAFSWLTKETAYLFKDDHFTDEELRLLEVNGTTTIEGFSGRYHGSRKEPDAFLRPSPLSMPTVAVEVAYSDSYAKLQRDGRLWLEGTDNAVNVVLLINLRLLNNRTRLGCNVEVWRRGVPPIRMTVAPDDSTCPATITLTRGEIFGTTVPSTRNALDQLHLSLARLRESLSNAADKMGVLLA